MILATDVSKFFGSFPAVQNVNFSVEKGEIIGFIGPNGAGKTTTMRMLTGYIPTSSGTIRIGGFDVFSDAMEVKKTVGYLPEVPPVYPSLTVGDYLSFVAEVRGVPYRNRSIRIAKVMEQVGLKGWEKRIIRSLSKGYKQRVGLAQAIIHDPQVLILDEPTSGLDPGQVVGIRKFIQELAETKTVILSTHILSEVELICQRAIIINKGRILADDPLDIIRDLAGGIRYRIGIRSATEDILLRLSKLANVEQVSLLEKTEDLYRVDIHATEDPRDTISLFAHQNHLQLREMERVVPTLEEAFLTIVEVE